MVKFQDTETCVKENKETGIVVFNNSCFGDIRTSWINNEPFFCLADVCRSLELDNPSCVTTRLDKKGIVTTYTLTTGGKQKMLFINEPNLYKCIFQVKKEGGAGIPRLGILLCYSQNSQDRRLWKANVYRRNANNGIG